MAHTSSNMAIDADVRAAGDARPRRQPDDAQSGDDLRWAPCSPGRCPTPLGVQRRLDAPGGAYRDRGHRPLLYASSSHLTGTAYLNEAKICRQQDAIEDLVAASRILAQHGVLDAYGHVSARSDKRPDHFIMSRSLAPALVTAADLMELDADSEAGGRQAQRLPRALHPRRDLSRAAGSDGGGAQPFAPR